MFNSVSCACITQAVHSCPLFLCEHYDLYVYRPSDGSTERDLCLDESKENKTDLLRGQVNSGIADEATFFKDQMNIKKIRERSSRVV